MQDSLFDSNPYFPNKTTDQSFLNIQGYSKNIDREMVNIT